MEASTINVLTDLLIDLDRAGVKELVPDGDSLRFHPQSAVTPDLAALLREYKPVLLTALRPPVGRVEPVEAGLIEECRDPPNPCPDCNGLLFWWNVPGDQRCMGCDPPTTTIRALEQVEKIRRRHGIPSRAGVPEMISDLKRLVPQNS